MAQVQLHRVRKVFPGSTRPAVEECTLEVRDGEFMVLVGPSGCGKTTTLRMIAGLEPLTEGEILIDGRPVHHLPPKDRDIAMVFQNYALYPHMTVYRNMAFGLLMARRPKAEIDRRVREAAELLGIGDLLDRLPRALSGGQRQRVALGRAIVRRPKVFLFDEPLSNLDARLRMQTRAELKRLHRRLGATAIYVTHDQVEAMTMGDRLCVLHEGRIRQIGEPLEVYRQPADRFVAGFLGSPPMNFVEGTLETSGEALAFVAGKLRLPLPARLAEQLRSLPSPSVVLGIRPEALRLGPVEAPPSLDSGDRLAIEGIVDIVEPMGAETVVHLTAGGCPLLARLEAGAVVPVPQSRVRIEFDAQQLYFFDPRSDRRLA